MKLRILIYDRFPVIKKALEIIIKTHFENCDIVFVENVDEIFTCLINEKYDLVFADLFFEKYSHFKLINKIRLIDVESKIILFTDYQFERKKLEKASEIEHLYILRKDSLEDQIVLTIKNALNGKINKTISARRKTKKITSKKKLNIKKIELLSKREFECALLLMKGDSMISISKKLKLAITTVSTYKKRIFEKTNTDNIVELTRFFDSCEMRI